MRTFRAPQAESTRILSSRARLGPMACRPLAFFAFCTALLGAHSLMAGALLAAQTTAAPAPAAAPAHKPVHAGKPVPSQKNAAATPPQPAAQPAPAPAPTQPKPPDWPANDLPAEASVVWDSQGLLIVAFNSSLVQILKEVSTVTGITVEGMDVDQRVFGIYGPGPARDVLSQLLDGSGYDVLMIGDRGQGTPRQIVLSSRSGGAAPHTVNNPPSAPGEEASEADQPAEEPQAEQPQPSPAPNSFVPPVPARTQQQIIQQLQQRQQQQQQQQNNQQNQQN